MKITPFFFVRLNLIHGVIKQGLLIFTSSDFFNIFEIFFSLLEDTVINAYEDSHFLLQI